MALQCPRVCEIKKNREAKERGHICYVCKLLGRGSHGGLSHDTCMYAYDTCMYAYDTCMYAIFMYIIQIHMYTVDSKFDGMYVCMYVCMYVVTVVILVNICLYTYTHT